MSQYFRKQIKKEYFPVHPGQIKYKTSFKNCVLETMKKRGWKEVEGDSDWDIIWIDKEFVQELFDHTHLNNNQRVNHFRNHYELTRKDLMIKNLKRYKKLLEKENRNDELQQLNFFPQTYNLPNDYAVFVEEFKRTNGDHHHSKHLWIMKPIGKAQGKGIFIFNKISQISNWKNSTRYNPDSSQAEPYVVQKYISNPLIIGGKKFDMRLYVLVTSYQPLTVYFYRNGFARFTHYRYDNEDINNQFVHLTNVAIQKTSENYDNQKGGKWMMEELKKYLMSKYGLQAVQDSFQSIQNTVIQSLLAVQKLMINDKHCFELYGYDILLDSQLKPWLLEVNSSPSMSANTRLDQELKNNILDDAFSILDLEKVLYQSSEQLNDQQKQEFMQQVGGFDCICWKGQTLNQSSQGQFATYLGAYNNRAQQMKRLAKTCSIKLANYYQLQQEQLEKQKELANQHQLKKQQEKNLKQQQSIPISNNQKQQQQQQLNNMVHKQQQQQQIQQSSTSSNLPRKGNLTTSCTNTNLNNNYRLKKHNKIHTIQQTTQFTQNVIANITNMANNQATITNKHITNKNKNNIYNN